MARKPNYDFERREREKAKAAKVAERTKARSKKPDSEEPSASAGDAPPADTN